MFDSFGRNSRHYQRLEVRMARLERMLAAILEHLNVPYDDSKAQDQMVSNRVRELVHAGQTIAAIKQYRQDTGVGLAEAKDVIDGLKGS